MGPLQVGTVLSEKYRIERLLAESGGVILYEATDTARAQRVWIKILERNAGADAQARFQREATGAKVLDVGENPEGLPYMVASEFGAPSEAAPPRPKVPLPSKRSVAVPPKKPTKTTLRGVAPPPPPLPKEETSIPLLGDDVVIEAEPTPPPQPAFTPPPEPEPPEPPEPKEPKEPKEQKEEEPPKLVAEPAIIEKEPPPPRRPAARTIPSLRVLEEQKKRSERRNLGWLFALTAVAVLTGIGGWYLGRRDAPVKVVAKVVAVPPTPTLTPTPTPTPSETAAPATPEIASATASASASATASSHPRPPPAHVFLPPRKPRKPAQTSGDPLTL